MSTWKPGDRVGSYRIEEALKSGGMETLVVASKIGAAGFARRVAIKVIHAHLATDPSFVRMFIDEAKLASRIQHPNVVHVEELGELDGTYYLVMEYVDGCSVGQLLASLSRQKRRLAPDVAIYIAAQIADGLHAAHETRGVDGEPLGVVHRDVSPPNVLVSRQGTVKLIDFGVAKARGRSQSTAGGSLRGKISYMAPEQAFGREVDRRTDVYALGIVLWEMLTCHRLFNAPNDFALLDLVRAPELVRPSRYAPGIAAALDDVVMSALAPRPEDRPATALELRCRFAELLPSALVLGPPQLGALVGIAAPSGAIVPIAEERTVTVAGEKSDSADLAIIDALTIVQDGLPAFDEDARSVAPDTASLPDVSSRSRLRRAALVSLATLLVSFAAVISFHRFGHHPTLPPVIAATSIRAPAANPPAIAPPSGRPAMIAQPPATADGPPNGSTSSNSEVSDRDGGTALFARRHEHPTTHHHNAAQTAPHPARPTETIHAPGPFPTQLGL